MPGHRRDQRPPGRGENHHGHQYRYTVAQTGKKVLLVECDLRLPTIGRRLGLHTRPGISNLLAMQCTGNEALQHSRFLDGVYVITAGDIPPNPAELLASDQMSRTVKALERVFDMIVLDLPPVCVVSDALIASKLIDGMVVVVRQDYCEKKAMAETVRQLKFSETRILGFAVTGSDIQKKNYRHYYSRHYEDGGYSHSPADSGHSHSPAVPGHPETAGK